MKAKIDTREHHAWNLLDDSKESTLSFTTITSKYALGVMPVSAKKVANAPACTESPLGNEKLLSIHRRSTSRGADGLVGRARLNTYGMSQVIAILNSKLVTSLEYRKHSHGRRISFGKHSHVEETTVRHATYSWSYLFQCQRHCHT